MSFWGRSQELAWMPRRLDCLSLSLFPSLQKVTYVQKKWKCLHTHTRMSASMQTHKTKQLGFKEHIVSFQITNGRNGSNGIGVHKGLTSKAHLLPLTTVPQTGMHETTSLRRSCLFQASQWVTEKRRLRDPLLVDPLPLLSVLAIGWSAQASSNPKITTNSSNKEQGRFSIRHWRTQVDNISTRNDCTHFLLE